jgi:5-methylcytosine-specific restriction protein A
MTMVATPCSDARCPRIASRAGRCAEHNREYERRRVSGAARGYGHAWQRLRRLILARDPICKTDGCGQPSTQVDHVISRRRGGTDDPSNLQGLCRRHHSSKTARTDSGWGAH